MLHQGGRARGRVPAGVAGMEGRRGWRASRAVRLAVQAAMARFKFAERVSMNCSVVWNVPSGGLMVL